MKTFLFAIGVFALVGCSGLKPVGPLAKEKPITEQGTPLPATAPPPQPSAFKPTPPTAFVTPDDVTANPNAAAGKLTNELDIDGKSTTNAPVTAEISRIKNGVKLQD